MYFIFFLLYFFSPTDWLINFLVFRNFCVECNRLTKRKKTTGLTCKPILSQTFNSRGQMDLIDS